jgi:hypothetical protein
MNEDEACLETLLVCAVEAESAGDTARSDEIFNLALEWEWWVVNPEATRRRIG